MRHLLFEHHPMQSNFFAVFQSVIASGVELGVQYKGPGFFTGNSKQRIGTCWYRCMPYIVNGLKATGLKGPDLPFGGRAIPKSDRYYEKVKAALFTY